MICGMRNTWVILRYVIDLYGMKNRIFINFFSLSKFPDMVPSDELQINFLCFLPPSSDTKCENVLVRMTPINITHTKFHIWIIVSLQLMVEVANNFNEIRLVVNKYKYLLAPIPGGAKKILMFDLV